MRKILAALLLMSLLGSLMPVANAHDEVDLGLSQEHDHDEALHAATDDDEDAVDPFEFFANPTVQNAYLLIKLQQYLARAEQNYTSLEDRMEDARSEIDENRFTIDSLEDEVTQLEKLIETTTDKIHNVEIQTAEKEVEIQDSLEAIEWIEIEIDEQENAIESYLQLLYFQKNLSYDANNEVNGLKILLQEGSVSQVLQRGTYLSFLEQQAGDLLVNFQELERSLRRQNYQLTVKRHQLANLQEELEGEQRNLAAQLEGKENLLAETLHSDEVYRELFASYKLAQEAILEEINLFSANIEALEGKISLSSVSLTAEELAFVEQIKSDSQLGYSASEAAAFVDLDWPVSPEMGLTAYFDDDGYVSTFGVAHHAVDIRIPHGSIIYAPADGVVYKVYDAAALNDAEARLGYGYLIIAHSHGVMTLYGHISSALVNEGDFIRRGQIIGLTGGTPGTPGAGLRTTGAHLHMEVIQSGVRVDPLEYLPLEEVPMDSLPEEYLPILQAQLEAALAEANVDVEAIEAMDMEEFEDAVQSTLDNSLLPEEMDDEEDFWSNGEQ